MAGAIQIASLFGVLELKDSMTPALDQAESRANQFGGFMKGAFKGAMIAGAAGIGVLTTGLGMAFNEAMEAQLGLAKMNAVLKSTKGASGMSEKALVDLADSLSQVTRFSDDSIISAETMLLTFTKIGSDVFPQATQATLDMAEMFGGDASQAAMQLGKALNDPIEGVSALRRVGVALSAEQEEQIKNFMALGDVASAQKIILDELATEFGGLAEAAGDTAAGKLAIFKNQIMNVFESVGTYLLPKLIDLADVWLPRIASAAQEMGARFVEGLGQIQTAYETGGISGVGQLVLDGIAAGWSDLTGWARDHLGEPLLDEIKRITWADLTLVGAKILTGIAGGIIDLAGWAAAKVGDPALQAIKTITWRDLVVVGAKILAGIAGGLAFIGDWAIEKIGQPIGDALTTIDPAIFAMMSVGLAAMTTQAIVTGLAGLATNLTAIATGAWAAAVPLLPLAGVLAVIGAVIYGYQNNFLGMGSAIDELGRKLTGMKDSWSKVFNGIAEIVKYAASEVEKWLGGISFPIPKAVQDLYNMIKDILDALGIIGGGTPAAELGQGGGGFGSGSSGGGGGVGEFGAASGVVHDFPGSYTAGQPYLIGTGAQPELFIPNQSGTAYPAGAYPAGRGGNLVVQAMVPNGSVLFEVVVTEAQRRNAGWA